MLSESYASETSSLRVALRSHYPRVEVEVDFAYAELLNILAAESVLT